MADYIFYPAIALTGGTDDALDGYDGDELNDKDVAIVVTATAFYHYILDDDSGAAESSPDVIKPDDNAGTKRWILTGVGGSPAPTAHKDSHDPNDGGDPLDTAAPAEMAGVQASAEGTSHSLARADHAHQVQHSIADNHLLTVDQADAANGEFAKFTAAGIESRSKAELLGDINVADGADVTGSNTPQDHKDLHDPADGGDPLDTAAPAEIAGVQASAVGTSHSLARADHAHQIQHGIADNHIVTIDQADAATGEFAKFTAVGIESRSKAELLSDINVDDGADVTGSNAPQAHKDSHDPNDGGDPLDTAAPAEIAGVQASAEGTSHSLARADHAHQVQHGIADNHLLTVDQADAATGEFAKFTANGIESRSKAELLSDINVEDGADKVVTVGIVADTTPQLGGDLDMNSKGIDFPTTPNITDCLDEDSLVSDSATKLATQQSIKAYVDSMAGSSSGCRVYDASLQSIPTGTWTLLAFDTETYDYQNEFDTTTHKFTAKVAGVYQVSGALNFTALADSNYYQLGVYINDALYSTGSRSEMGGAGQAISVVSVSVPLAVGDTVSLYGYHNNGGNIDTVPGVTLTYLIVQKMTAATEHGSAHENSSYVKVSDVKATTTDGGTFTQDTWQTRDLNTEDNDPDAVCSLSSNQVTLSAGTYEVRASAPAYDTVRHQIRLRNITAGTTLVQGTNARSDSAGNGYTVSSLVGRFTIAANQALEVQHRCSTTKSDTGFGVANDFGGDEVYTVAEFWKISETGWANTVGFSSRASAYLSAAQEIPTTTWTKLELNTEEFDGLGEYNNTSTYRFTAAATGYYMICANSGWAALEDTKYCATAIYKNGSAVAYNLLYSSGAGQDPRAPVSKLLYLVANDYVELWGKHTNVAAQDCSAGLVSTYMTVHRVS